MIPRLRIPCLLLASLVPSVASADCPSVAPVLLLDHAERAVLEGRLDDYPALSEAVDGALSCGAAATPQMVARLLLIDGLHRHFTGEVEGAALAFQSAARLAPELWNPDYGAAVRGVYDDVVARSPEGTGTLMVEPAPDTSLVTLLDGSPVSMPTDATVGFHVVQVLAVDGPALYAVRTLLLDPGERVVVNSGPLQLPSTAVSESVASVAAPVRSRPSWPLLTAGSLALLGGGAAALAASRDAKMQQASTVDDLDTAYKQQRVFAVSAWTLGGLAATGVGVWVAW